MALPTLNLDQTGNVEMADAQRLTFNALTSVPLAAALQPYIVVVTATPNAVLTAPKGSVAININGSGVADRMYINTNGTTAWTNVTTAG